MKILLTGGCGGQVGSEFIALVASHNQSSKKHEYIQTIEFVMTSTSTIASTVE